MHTSFSFRSCSYVFASADTFSIWDSEGVCVSSSMSDRNDEGDRGSDGERAIVIGVLIADIRVIGVATQPPPP